MNNLLKKISLVIGIASLFLSINKNTYVLAEEQLEEPTTELQILEKESPKYGLMGYYFEDENFSTPILVAPTGKKGLSYEKEDAKDLISEQQIFRSYRWMGYIYSDTSKDITLQLSEIEDFIIEIEGTIVSKPGKLSTVHLEKDTLVEIKIEARSSEDNTIEKLQNIQLVSNEDGKKEEIKAKQLRNIDSNQEKWQKKISQAAQKNLFGISPYADKPTKDTDGDNIYDEWEINGYTIQNKIAVPWKEEYAEKGYTKFVSNPLEAHTAGDPYSDYEKAAKDMPLSNSEEVFNPLVAAFPVVNANLEKIILSVNEDLSNSVSSNHSTNWTYSNTEGVDITAGWQGLGPNFGVTGHYSHSESVANEWGGSNDDTTHLNSAESAYLNANVRYNNVGTGAIYYVRPTTSFILGDSTIGTIKAKDNTEALSLVPNSSYPRKGNHGIAINTMDDFNSRPIPLNKNQLSNFMSNKEALKLETDQVSGKYASKDVHGNIVIQGDWNGIQDNIDARTASIVLDLGENVVARKIAAKNYSDPEDKTPELTLKEALKIGFNDISEQEGKLFYKNKSIDEYHSLAYMDEYTAARVREQLSDNNGIYRDVKDLYNVKLEPKMAITLKQSLFYDDSKSKTSPLGTLNNSVEHKEKDDIGNVGGVYYARSSRPSFQTVRLDFNDNIRKNLNPNSKYCITLSLKAETSLPTSAVTLRTLGKNGIMNGFNQKYESISTKGYQKISVIYDPGLSGGNTILQSLEISFFSFPTNLDAQGIYFKDISITDVGTWK